MKYGVVKDGKILYKYGFKEQHGPLPQGATLLPVNEASGKGKVTFAIVGSAILATVTPGESKRLKLGKTMILENMSDFVWEYLEKYWKENKSNRWEGSLEITEWDMTKKPWAITRKELVGHAWTRYGAWVKEQLLTAFTYNDANEPCGVLLEDVVMFLALGNDYPVQPIGAESPLSNAQLNQAKTEFKQRISAKRQGIENAIKVNGTGAAAYRTAFEGLAKYVMRGETS